VWHQAAAATRPDERVAADLEAAAGRAAGRGATVEQAAALARAAALTAGPARRGQRLIRAARAFEELGRPQAVLRLLDEAEPLDLDPGDRLWLSWRREVLGGATRSGARPVGAFAELADRMRRAGDADRALDALEEVSLRCWWSNPDPQTRQRMTAVAEAIPVDGDDPRLLNVLAMAEPAGCGAAVLQRLGRHRPGSGPTIQDVWLGGAALAIGACEQAAGFLAAAEAGCRARGQLGGLGRTLLTRSWATALAGRADLAGPAAEEASRLLAEVGDPVWAACAQTVLAVLAGLRGDAVTAAGLAARAERVLLFAGVSPLLAQVQLARGATELGAGRYEEAYQELARIFDPADPAHHPHLRAWALLDLAEAASHAGHRDAARAWCAGLAPEAAATGSPLLRASLAVAAPMLAGDDAGPLYDEALGADLAAWPLHRARLQLAHGMWLRRRYQVTESRVPLRAARAAFDALGAAPWARRARQELDAAGEPGGQSAPSALDLLAPQELQIARLAAQGQTNKQIGQQLYLSHRTVSTHLYRIFPKLGITSRAQLAAALATSPAPA